MEFEISFCCLGKQNYRIKRKRILNCSLTLTEHLPEHHANSEYKLVHTISHKINVKLSINENELY